MYKFVSCTFFRNNVLQNLEAAAFNKPICEVLLNQKYFNGIGNYLRAEILYRFVFYLISVTFYMYLCK